jgi:hypothetical protein
MGVRSHYVRDEWDSTPRAIPSPVNDAMWGKRRWVYERRIFSSRGYLELHGQELVEATSKRSGRTPGYHPLPPISGPLARGAPRSRPSNRYYSGPGFAYYFRPTSTAITAPKVMNPNAPKERQIMIGGPTLYPGILTIGISWWLIAALSAILPLLWCLGSWRRLRRKRTHLKNCCPACGYDMRATPQRCPECGTAAIVVNAA